MGETDREKLGPLGPLLGTWEGDKGDDRAPSDDRGVETNVFRERMKFEATGLVENHEQKLYGLRYATTAWRIGEEDPFHEELGYWLWDAATGEITRCFLVPRGVALIAGGTAAPDAREFRLSAAVGSDTYGILSAVFLDREFKTLRYDLKVTIHDDDNFSYEEDSQLRIKGHTEIFHHTDKNTLRRVD